MRGYLTVGFIGEPGAHSFLEQIRQIFRKNSGESAFTQDIQRFNMVDGPSHHASQRAVQLPSPTRRDELINLFEINVQPFAYVFHMDDFRQVIQETYDNPFGTPRHSLCLIHLSFAISAGHVNEEEVVRFFESGMGLLDDPIEDGNLWIVQAFLLVALYYQLVCKRNAFWISLGNLSFRYPGYEPRTVVKRECENSSNFCHCSPQCGKIMIPRYLMDLNLPFPILYSEFVYLL